MTQDKRTKLNSQISEEAAEWFIEFRTGDIDTSGRQEFDAWVRSSPEHLRAYLEIAAIWNEGSSLGVSRDLDSAALIALARAEENVVPLGWARPVLPPMGREAEASSSPQPSKEEKVSARWTGEASGRREGSISRSWFLSFAATLATVIVAAAIILSVQLSHGTVYATDVGERRSIKLEDGSSIELNSRSRIRVRFSKAERHVDLLEGQVLFQVAKDVGRPFVVRSDSVHVRAVGTQFDVYRRATGTTVTVVEGRVAVLRAEGAENPLSTLAEREGPTALPGADRGNGQSAGTAAVFLSAGDQLTVTGQVTSTPLHTSTSAATAWTQGQLVLESALLTDVAEEFNRYSTRRLTVEDHGAHPLRLSGVFSTDPDFLIRYLRQRSDITVQETESGILIFRHE